MKENILIKPNRLKPGDTIGIVSPAGPVKDSMALKRAVSYFESKGFLVKIAPHANSMQNYLAGSDIDRAKDLMDFFKNDSINAIVCSRGGYGSHRILELLDYDLIRANPKVFVGYSDITVLHCAIQNKAGLITFHGAMASGDFGIEDVDLYTEKAFFDVLLDNSSTIMNSSDYKCISEGFASGRLIGGNLAILCALIGTDYAPSYDGNILFIEDIGEPLYKVDRMLMQMKLSGCLSQISGLVVGDFSNLDDKDGLVELIKEIIDGDIPIGFGFSIGHERQKATLPLGVKCSFDSSKGELNLVEDYLKN